MCKNEPSHLSELSCSFLYTHFAAIREEYFKVRGRANYGGFVAEDFLLPSRLRMLALAREKQNTPRSETCLRPRLQVSLDLSTSLLQHFASSGFCTLETLSLLLILTSLPLVYCVKCRPGQVGCKSKGLQRIRLGDTPRLCLIVPLLELPLPESLSLSIDSTVRTLQLFSPSI